MSVVGLSKIDLIQKCPWFLKMKNTCSRIETNGMAGRIHISREMADILIANGKAHWVQPRTEKVIAKVCIRTCGAMNGLTANTPSLSLIHHLPYAG
jgi:hypothetical protein